MSTKRGVLPKEPKLLQHKVTLYKSAEITDPICTDVELSQVPTVTEFESRLFATMVHFRRKQYKGVWLTIVSKRAAFIPAAVRVGFKFHHCDPERMIMTAWLQSKIPNKLPPGPMHFIGVGGFVVNDKQEILTIREKSGPAARYKDFWKLPGGLVDPQEDIQTAVIREVKEETGIDAEFVSIAAIQELHHSQKLGGAARGGTTDLYTICVCRAKDPSQQIVIQEDEISEAKWMPIKEFLSSPYFASEDHAFKRMYSSAAAAAVSFTGLAAGQFQGYGPRKDTVYYSDSKL